MGIRTKAGLKKYKNAENMAMRIRKKKPFLPEPIISVRENMMIAAISPSLRKLEKKTKEKTLAKPSKFGERLASFRKN